MGFTRMGRLGEADLGLGRLGRSRMGDIVRKGRAGFAAAPQLWALVALCLALMGFEQVHTLAFRAPSLRAVIETVITLCALAAACLFSLSFDHRRRVRDLLLVGVLLELGVIDFVSYVLPTAIGLGSPGLLTAAPKLGTLFIVVAILGGAWVGPDRQVGRGRRPLALTIAAGLLAAMAAELGGLALPAQLTRDGGVAGHGVRAALQHPVGVVFALAATSLLIVAARRTAGSDRRSGTSVSLLLAAALVAFAGAWLNYIVLPTSGIDWVTAREAPRLAGYFLILAAAVRQEAQIRRAIADASAANERRRIARDLHDGLAQDLAFIAAHGDRIAREGGEDHPLAIAARRALAVSRGAIADLSASHAPSAGAALRQVADELEVRFGVRVSVDADVAELSRDARDDVVRIVREAIVNAAHAQARNVVVSLVRSQESFVLRVLDDGVGIGAELKARPGFGLRAMRERAVSLGGGLSTRPARDGGTELEVVFR
jgi:signal transduction histidine kinase